MENLEIEMPSGWTCRNEFEDLTLSSGHECGQGTPLYHAASLRWSGLSDLLVELGSGPQSACFQAENRRSGTRSSVLSRVIATTGNGRDEAQDLLKRASDAGQTCLITPEDISTILDLRSKTMKWHRYAYLVGTSSGYNTTGLWPALAEYDQRQSIPLRSQDKQSRLIIEAALCRDYDAVKGMLKMGFDPNGYIPAVTPLHPLRLQTTALDMVSWTASLDETLVHDDLRAADTEIAMLLRSQGGTRGREYTWEFQILAALVQGLLPVALLEASLGSAIYFSGRGFWYGARTTVRACPDPGVLFWPCFAVEKIGGPAGVFITPFLFCVGWGLDEPVSFREYSFVMLAGGLGVVIVVLMTVSCAPNGLMALFGIVLSDVLGATIWACLVSGFFFNRFVFGRVVLSRTKYLAERFHGNCPNWVVFRLLRTGMLDGVSTSRYYGRVITSVESVREYIVYRWQRRSRPENSENVYL